jgi:hypothetical protein
MSLQTIINNADTVKINRRRMVGIQMSRNEIAYTSETPTRNPWQLTVKVSKLFRYEQARAMLESIDYLDRDIPETITFSDNAGLNFMFAYQGELTAELANIEVDSFVGNQLTITTLGSISSGDLIYARGDFIQIDGHPYPFTVVDNLYRNADPTQTLTTHRPNFITADVAGQGIVVGNDVDFRVICPNMPTYTIRPGGSTALVEFDTEFQLYEYTGGA